MPKPEKFLVQIRLSDADRRRIKSLAAKQGLTLQDAVVEAFNAWAEKLRTQPHALRPALFLVAGFRPADPRGRVLGVQPLSLIHI